MTHHVAGSEPGDADPGQTLDRIERVLQAAPLTRRQIDLRQVAGDDHPRAFAHAGEKHLHLHRRGVLRFVENDERMRQRPAAHEGEGRDFDLARAHAADHLIARHHVVQRVVERPQIRIDLLLHVARQEAEPLAGLDRRPRKDDLVHLAGLQQHHTLSHRQIRLAGASRADGKHHLVLGQHLHVARLLRRARPDGAPLGQDRRQICQRKARIANRVGHADGGIDVGTGQALAGLEPFVERVEGLLGCLNPVRIAMDGDTVTARGQSNLQALFEPD